MKFNEMQNRIKDEQEERFKFKEEIRSMNDVKMKLDQDVRKTEK